MIASVYATMESQLMVSYASFYHLLCSLHAKSQAKEGVRFASCTVTCAKIRLFNMNILFINKWMILCLATVILLVSLSAYSSINKTILSPGRMSERYVYRGLGMTGYDIPVIGSRVYSYQLVIGDITYRASRLGDNVFKFQIHDNGLLLCEGTTVQHNLRCGQTGGYTYNFGAVIQSRNYNASRETIAEVVDGCGIIVLPSKPDSYRYSERISVSFRIKHYSVDSVCFFDKEMREIDFEMIHSCAPYMR